jgi:tRNA nucleotidyltransferase (CCA-adding enzyme)
MNVAKIVLLGFESNIYPDAPVTMDMISILTAIASNFLCCIIQPPEAKESFAPCSPSPVYNRSQPHVISMQELEDMRVRDQSYEQLSRTDRELESCSSKRRDTDYDSFFSESQRLGQGIQC